MKFKLNTKCLEGNINSEGQAEVKVENLKTGKTEIITGDVCLISTGRKPFTTGLGLE